MCILCNAESLRLLVTPLPSLSNPQLAESIRIAREAAMQLALDAADALVDQTDADAALRSISPEEYIRYVVERAERDGIADIQETSSWTEGLREQTLLSDPRVQAFLSSSTEALALYIDQIGEKREVLERFLEVRPGEVTFGGIGSWGEISFDGGDEKFLVLTEDEAMQIAVDRIGQTLWEIDPTELLQYTNLPADALDILVSAQQRPQEEANDVLAGIVDLPSLALDHVRRSGYGRFIAEGLADDFTEQRFGELLVVRFRASDSPRHEF